MLCWPLLLIALRPPLETYFDKYLELDESLCPKMQLFLTNQGPMVGALTQIMPTNCEGGGIGHLAKSIGY